MRLKCPLISCWLLAPIAPDKPNVCPSLKWTSSPVSCFLLFLSPLVTAATLVPHIVPGINRHSCMFAEWREEGKPVSFFFSSTRYFFTAVLKASAEWICALLIVNTDIFKLNYLLSVHCAQDYACSLGCQGVWLWIPVSSWSGASWIQVWALSPDFLWSSFGSPAFPLSDLRQATWADCFIPCICKMREIVPIS